MSIIGNRGKSFAAVVAMSVCSVLTAFGQSADGRTKITFWHSMGGAGGKAIEQMVSSFNASQSSVFVDVQYQGTYDEAVNKIQNASIGSAKPDVMQLYDIGTRWMIDSGEAVKMQNFIKKDKYDVSSLEENILAYYSVDGDLWSMPFNSSTPILYYNKDAFRDAGLDPNVAPKNLDEMIAFANKIVKKDGNKVVRYGAAIQIYGWLFEQFLVKMQADYADNGNGRAKGATSVAFDQNGAGLAIMKKWKEAVDSGSFANLGRNGDVNLQAFTAGTTAMYVGSTANLSTIKAGINGKFELGTAYYPSVRKEDKGGVSIGGGSLWIMNGKDQKKKDAAWQFVKFMVTPEQQVLWAKATGYFPITKKAYDLQEMKDQLAKNPEFRTAIDQLHASAGSKGALLAVFPESRACIEENIEKMLAGQQSPEQAVQASAKTINKAIERYNKTK